MSNAITRQSADPRLLFPFLVLSVSSALRSKEGTMAKGHSVHTHRHTMVLMSQPVLGTFPTPGWLL